MNILDPRFKYIPAARTNVAATFARIRKEMKAKEEAEKRKVQPLKVARG